MNRRIRLGDEVVGKATIRLPPVQRRVDLRYEGWRLKMKDGRVSVEVFIRHICNQVIRDFEAHGTKLEIVPAYVEQIEEVQKDDDIIMELRMLNPDGYETSQILHFGYSMFGDKPPTP